MVLVHTAQILNAVAGPMVIATVTKLSSSWFPVNERTTATAIAVLFNNFGAAVGFLLMPAVVKNYSDMPTLLYIQLGFGVGSLLSVIAFFPNQPPSPPSASAAEESSAKAQSLRAFFKDIMDACRCVPFMLLAQGYGIMSGVFNAWSGILSTILSGQYDDTASGWFSFASTIAVIVGGFIVGPLADRMPLVRNNFKMALLLLLVLCLGCFVWFTLCFPIMGLPALLPSSFWTVAISITVSGFFMGGTYPLFYELSVELTFPVAEATSAGVLTLVSNLWSLIFLFVAPALPHEILNTLMAVSVVVCLLLMVFARESYKRREFEREQQDLVTN